MFIIIIIKAEIQEQVIQFLKKKEKKKDRALWLILPGNV